MFLAAINKVGLQGRVERIDVAVSMLAGQHILVFRERAKVSIVLEEATGKLTIARTCASLVSKIEILRKSVAFIPGEGDVFVRARHHLRTVEGFRRKERQHCIRGTIEDGKSLRIASKLMSVDEATVGL